MENNLGQFYHKSKIKKAEKTYWQDLYGSGIGLAIASIAHTTPLIIITPDIVTGINLENEVRFFLRKNTPQILTLPGWEILPYDHFSPHEEIISQRLLTLYQLPLMSAGIIFVAVEALMHRLPPKNYVEANSLVLSVGDEINFSQFRSVLESHGYYCVTKVMTRGEFAVRGSIIDIFPSGSKVPFRIDRLDTTIESIRTFDVDTQRSIQNITNIKLLPAKEFPLDDQSVERFRQAWRQHFSGNPLQCQIYQDISSKKSHPGIEYYLPLFFENTATLFDYLPANSTAIITNNFEKNMQDFWHEINVRHEQLRHDKTHPRLPPTNVFVSPQQVLGLVDSLPQIVVNQEECEKIDDKNIASFYFETKNFNDFFSGQDVKSKLNNLQNVLMTQSHVRTLFVAESIGRREVLLELLSSINIVPIKIETWQEFIKSSTNIAIIVAKITQPLHMVLRDSGIEILIITESQIFGEQITPEYQKVITPQKVDTIIRDLIEIQIGAPVVHIDYGIGRYLGLQKLKIDSYDSEFLVLEYADNAKLYVPVTAFNLISRYTGIDAEHAPLNHLGSKQWKKIKQHAEKKVRDTAVELLEIYAKRSKAHGFTFIKPTFDYERFIAAFPFVVTPDQQRAIDEVIVDMISGKPMDRLVCGDVGFGKTEVAMRAVFLAICNNKQVAILTPTTLLAQQHFTNFQDRFALWPVKIALFSRFRSSKEQKIILDDLANGKIDIVIGTHKLLQKNVKFKQLGLLIIDEEHRFGVKQKEHIKQIATNIDILALTATPIPRTLNMAFAGIRDFSIISTPPAKRLAIKTFIREYDKYLIKEAITREILRGGQVYFLHNNISTIEKTARELHQLVPTANIVVAHGQMRKQQLELIMRDFYHLRTNVLVCTTIIESGLDVPTANTIIIDRADRFGLAQLHQLRGRVGRSHHQAYAYLIIPPESILTIDAKKRLDAVMAMKDLGTGFMLATHDLEIRGAGELLGEKQSGVIQSIGFTLYMEMLERAVKTLKTGKVITKQDLVETKPEFDLQISALIPEQYISDANLRLVFYKKIAEAKDQHELESLQVEMIDRFGFLPEYVKNLFKIAALQLKAQKLKIAKITMGADKGTIEFAKDCGIDPKKILQLIQKHCVSYKFLGSYTIRFTYNHKIPKIKFVEILLGNNLEGNSLA